MENLEERVQRLEQLVEEIRIKNLVPPQLQAIDANEEFNSLKLLLNSNLWPKAIDPKLICDKDTEKEKEDRADRILNFFLDMPLEHLKFLDFGCGEGHVLKRAVNQKPTLAVGYDVVASDRWKDESPLMFTTDWEKVKANGPYNAVLMYDVIDHLEKGNKEVERKDMVDILKNIKKTMTPNGKLYVRCHPWCSRHSTHLHTKINKAFIHLVFSETELKEMGYESDVKMAYHIIHPTEVYKHIFDHAGFRIVRRDTIEENVEPFFRDTPIVAKRIKRNWLSSPDRNLANGVGFPHHHMKFQFLDFVLG